VLRRQSHRITTTNQSSGRVVNTGSESVKVDGGADDADDECESKS
jgi:hypothetical protein